MRSWKCEIGKRKLGVLPAGARWMKKVGREEERFGDGCNVYFFVIFRKYLLFNVSLDEQGPAELYRMLSPQN